ncbi:MULTISPECIES: hypothetical protein [Streptomyces]|uniref:hypothetical protein n=1 Tax=Streptomyces TaxID=1883 RepID=UPI000AF9B273|nr:hypothetical protein [Streptomyces venezuelae]
MPGPLLLGLAAGDLSLAGVVELAARPRTHDALRAATEAAAQAQTRTVEHLLAVRLKQLHR